MRSQEVASIKRAVSQNNFILWYNLLGKPLKKYASKWLSPVCCQCFVCCCKSIKLQNIRIWQVFHSIPNGKMFKSASSFSYDFWEIFLVWCGMTLNYSKLTILFSGQRYKPRLCHLLHGGWHEHWGQGQQPWLHFKEFQILASKIVFTSISYCIVGAGNMSKSNFKNVKVSMTQIFNDIQ